MLGVISETAGIVLGESLFNWQGRYLKNEFGGLIYEDTDVTFVDSEGIQRTEIRRLPKKTPTSTPMKNMFHDLSVLNGILSVCLDRYSFALMKQFKTATELYLKPEKDQNPRMLQVIR